MVATQIATTIQRSKTITMNEIYNSKISQMGEIPEMNNLQLFHIPIDEEYRKEWHVSMNDFVCLIKNGKRINDSIYRVGGFGVELEEKYFMLLKYEEAFYSKDILRMSKNNDPKHLEGRWCILDKNGNEKIVFEPFKSPYVKAGSCIYSIDGNYYNIETGEFYCNAFTCVESSDFLFLENRYDKDLSRRGVMQINKKTGELVIIP